MLRLEHGVVSLCGCRSLNEQVMLHVWSLWLFYVFGHLELTVFDYVYLFSNFTFFEEILIPLNLNYLSLILQATQDPTCNPIELPDLLEKEYFFFQHFLFNPIFNLIKSFPIDYHEMTFRPTDSWIHSVHLLITKWC